jgi:hypothetical protein
MDAGKGESIHFPEVPIGFPFSCPHCGQLLFDDEKGITGECPHLVFSYCWGVDPDCFIATRTDYAKTFLRAVKATPYYQEYCEECVEDGKQSPPFEELELKFINGDFEPGDDTSTEMACICEGPPHSEFPEILPKDTIVYTNHGYYSGVFFAISGLKVDV